MIITTLVVIFSFGLIPVLGVDAKIDTIVVLMQENRAFDHMLGWMARGGSHGDTRIDGLTGDGSKFCNAKNISLPVTGDNVVCVNDKALDHCPYDPDHSFQATTERIYACKYKNSERNNINDDSSNPCIQHNSTSGTPTMGGFVQSAIWRKKDGLNEMSMWPPEKVPIITTLAKEFANFDRFFCSHPGPTFPNRQFVHSAAANGEINDEVPKGGFTQKTLFRLLEENKKTWKMYYEDSLSWAIFMTDLRRNVSKPNLLDMSAFYKDAAAGTLPHYSFIEPRISTNHNASHLPSYGLANHQHPTASVQEGERLMKNMYEALRNGPKWNSTLYIITYDEHGGFYDHVPPPQVGVPNPDGVNSTTGFTYERLGVRIPTIAISPWIERGILVHEPPSSQKPTHTSQWELSSIVATVQKLLGLQGGPLTRRDAWAATFEHLISRDSPRTDCLKKLPDIPPPTLEEIERQSNLPIDEHAEAVISILCEMTGEDNQNIDETGDFCLSLGICRPNSCGKNITTNTEFSEWRVRMWDKWMNM